MPSQSTITLYGSGRSRSFRVLWALEEVGVDYEYVDIDFADKSEDGPFGKLYLGLNSQGKVPTLVDGELVLTESAAIVTYLASKAEHLQLKPSDGTALRAKYDEICFFILCELEQPLWTKGKHKFALPKEYRTPQILTTTVTFEFEKAQSALLQLLQGCEYAVGDQFTMADILLAQTIGWASQFDFNVCDKLIDYREKMILRPAYTRATQKLGT